MAELNERPQIWVTEGYSLSYMWCQVFITVYERHIIPWHDCGNCTCYFICRLICHVPANPIVLDLGLPHWKPSLSRFAELKRPRKREASKLNDNLTHLWYRNRGLRAASQPGSFNQPERQKLLMIHCTRKAQRVAAISDPRVKACKRESERLVGNETFKTSDGTRSLMKGEIICDQLGRTAFIRTLEWDPNHRAFQTVNTAQHNGQNEGLWWRNYRRRGSNLSAERCVTKVEINPFQDCCELTVRNAVCYLAISWTITTDTAFFFCFVRNI